MIRRKELPQHLRSPYRAFLDVLSEIEPAKAGIADVVPSTRLPGRPWRDAVGEYRMRISVARGLMPPWRCDELATEWAACDDGLRRALERAERSLTNAEEPAGFEELLRTVERLMDPLDPFVAAAERFSRLRRRRRAD
jgi:hypothetical protein